MTYNLCSQKRSWITLAATFWLALLTSAATKGETGGSAGATVANRANCPGPGTLSESILVEEPRSDPNVNARRPLVAAQVRTKACGEPCVDRLQPLVGFSSRTGDEIQKGQGVPITATGKAASRVRVHVFRSHGWSSLFGRGRFPATFAKHLSGDPDDDQASDNPNDDDDAYADIDVYDNTDVPNIGWLPVPVPFLAVPEFATEPWVAPSFTPFSTLKRLRC
jgi:hypothetical protein